MSNATRLAELQSLYGSILSPGDFQKLLKGARDACVEIVQPESRAEYNTFVASCMLMRLTDREQVVYANRQYVLTLWPAFVGFIASLGPDPWVLVYDNFWWAVLLGLTCGGLPGLGNSLPPHHLEALTIAHGRGRCESWTYNRHSPKSFSRGFSRRYFPAGRAIFYAEWAAFLLSVGIYLVFIGLFTYTLQDTFAFLVNDNYWLVPATWYYLSIVPALVSSIVELVNNRIELYEPITAKTSRVQSDTSFDMSTLETHRPNQVREPSVVAPSVTSSASPTLDGIKPNEACQDAAETIDVPQYQRSSLNGCFRICMRIVKLQWQRSPFRILVKPKPRKGKLGVFNAVGGIIVGTARIAIFAVGSTLMGDLVFMPWPNDLVLFCFLLFASLVPRLMWPNFWTASARGADLVVWVHFTALEAMQVRTLDN